MPRSLSIRLPRALAGLAAACLAVSAATATAAAPAKPLKKVTITVGTQVLRG